MSSSGAISPRLITRLGRGIELALVAVALFVPVAEAEVPVGPRLTFTRVSNSRVELVSSDPSGSDLQVIAGGGERAQPLPFVFSPPSWSADGARVAFAGLTNLEGESRSDIYLANADGSELVELPGTREALYPVLSPDGKKVAFGRDRKRIPHAGGLDGLSIWLAEVGGGKPQQLTPWRNGVLRSPSSFSPDGSTLALTLDTSTRHMAIALSLVGAGRKIIARNAGDPVYSPDGTRVAWVTVGRSKTIESVRGTTTFTQTELAAANADGSGVKRLTATPRALEIHPSWTLLGSGLPIPSSVSAGQKRRSSDSAIR